MNENYTVGEWLMTVLFIKYIEKFGLSCDAPEDEVKKWLKDVALPILKQIFLQQFLKQIFLQQFEIKPSVCGSNNKEDIA